MSFGRRFSKYLFMLSAVSEYVWSLIWILLFLSLQNPNQRRKEKAEILEYTVLFLQNSVAKNAKDEEEKEKCKFMDGFSTCLEKAAGFLSDEGEARGFQGSVTATLCQRLKQPCVPAHIRLPVKLQNSSRMKVPESHAQQHHRLQTPVCKQGLSAAFRNIVLHHNRFPHRSTEPNMLQCHENTHSAARPTSQLQPPVIQPMWRPWPWKSFKEIYRDMDSKYWGLCNNLICNIGCGQTCLFLKWVYDVTSYWKCKMCTYVW